MMLALRPYELRVTSADHAGKVGTKLRLRLQIGIAPLVNGSSREKPTFGDGRANGRKVPLLASENERSLQLTVDKLSCASHTLRKRAISIHLSAKYRNLA